MKSKKGKLPLVRVDHSDVEKWFRGAWKKATDYPNATICQQVATRINTIVERHNARLLNDASTDALNEEQNQLLIANKAARALDRKLHPVLRDFELKAKILAGEAIRMRCPPLEIRIKAVKEAQRAIRVFRRLCPPADVRDHDHPISWIAAAARWGWDGHLRDRPADQRSNITFGKTPESPLVRFIYQSLLAIGMKRSRETISQYLRGRHDRVRDR